VLSAEPIGDRDAMPNPRWRTRTIATLDAMSGPRVL
jgi:hypothetical protein